MWIPVGALRVCVARQKLGICQEKHGVGPDGRPPFVSPHTTCALCKEKNGVGPGTRPPGAFPRQQKGQCKRNNVIAPQTHACLCVFIIVFCEVSGAIWFSEISGLNALQAVTLALDYPFCFSV